MDEVMYVHVKWPTGDHDMMPESTAHIRAEAGDFVIVDPTPGRWRAFKPRWPLGAKHPGSNDADDQAVPPFSAWKVDELRAEVELRNQVRDEGDKIPDGTKPELIAALEADEPEPVAVPTAPEPIAPEGEQTAEEATA